MNRKIVLPVVFVCLAACGVMGSQAVPVCEHLVKSYKTIRTRNKVSPATAARWALWNETHPDFKPHARPKYKYSKQEVEQMVGFACKQVRMIPNEEVALLPASPESDYLSENRLDTLPDYTVGISEVAVNDVPALPFVPPYTAAGPVLNPTPVPEPGALVLLATGLGAALFLRSRRRGAVV